MARRDPIYDMKFYLSGPMSGLPEYNYPTFEAAVRYLRAHQLYVESPHENEWPDKYDDADHLDSIMLEKAVHQMNRCNAIILLPGWPFSKAVRVELDLAISNKWPVFYFTMEDKPFIRSTLIRMDTLEMSQCRHEIMRYAGFWDGLLWWICAVDPESGCRFKIANREAVSKK